MTEVFNTMKVLRTLLRAPLGDIVFKRREFAADWQTRDEVVVTHRFLILESGCMDYTVEDVTYRLEEGAQFFVPACCRRGWRIPARVPGCRLSWCEFSSGETPVPPVMFRRELTSQEPELSVFNRMRSLGAGAHVELLREGELKALLARFWVGAEAMADVLHGEAVVHPEVARALGWLEAHYADADALGAFYRTVKISPNHFRLLFRRQTGETVQAVLARLRLRRARYLVRETALPMKQIATEAGFADPLYFSNQYRKFWGRPASRDRSGGGVA